MATDKVFAQTQRQIAGFSFNETVANVFEDMISRSVPGYELTLEMLGVITQQYSQENTYCYDIGCSLGASTFAMQKKAKDSCHIIGIDNSDAMVARAKGLLATSDAPNMDIICADACQVDFKPASVVASNFTLQFIPVAERSQLLNRIAKALVNKGVLVLSEKITFDDNIYNNTMIDLYHDFKKGRGYSALEVSQKRSALENVLIPETLNTHKQRLLEAGFSQVMPWFQCFNFCSMIAIK